MTPFTGSQRDNLTHDAYNFYLSQMRIRIEMAFGRLTNKFRILRTHLGYSLSKSAEVLQSCAILHNYIIDFDGFKDDDEDNTDSSDFVITNAPNGMRYLPNIPDGLELVENTSQSQQYLVRYINDHTIRRPLHNIIRNNNNGNQGASSISMDDEYYAPR